MSSSSKPRRSDTDRTVRYTTRTLRLEEDLDLRLQEIAKKRRVSTNQVANAALRRYLEWDLAASTRTLVSVPSKLLAKLMEAQTLKGARELGRWAGLEMFVPNLKAQFANLDVSSAVEGVRMLSTYGGRFSFDHSVSDGRHKILIRQPMGTKWSEYYAGAIEAIFGTYLKKKVVVKVTQDISLSSFEE